MYEILEWFRYILNICYFFIPERLVLFAFSLLVLTISKILDSRIGFANRIIKVCVLILYIVYSLYMLGVFFVLEQVQDAGLFELVPLLFPLLCMFWVTITFKRKKIPGTRKKIFNYLVMFILYFIVSFVIYFFLMPESMIFEINLAYMIILFVLLFAATEGGIN